jgi:hypothetical protein
MPVEPNSDWHADRRTITVAAPPARAGRRTLSWSPAVRGLVARTTRSAVAVALSLALVQGTSLAEGGGGPASVEILFLGDTSFGENYQEILARRGRENILTTRGYDYPISGFGDLLANASFVVANLETPITDLKKSPLDGRKNYLHHSDPRKTPAYLRKYNIGLVSLANNHTMDFGGRGLTDTFNALDAHGISWCGAGPNAARAERPFVKTVAVGTSHFTMALICAFEFRRNYEDEYRFYATAGRPGVGMLSVDRIRSQVEILRKLYEDIYVVVFPHWGKNYKLATGKQRELARGLIDAGADLVIGHGSRLLQELEYRDGRWIVYSLGNFVFLSPGRYRKYEVHPYSMIGKMILRDAGTQIRKRLRLYPIVTDNTATGYRSRFVSGREFFEVSKLLSEFSATPETFEASVQTGRDAHGRYLEIDPESAR